MNLEKITCTQSFIYDCMVSKRFFLMLIVDEMDRILLISNDIHFSRQANNESYSLILFSSVLFSG